MTEFKRIWNKKFMILIVTCLFLNIFLFLYQQVKGSDIGQFYENETQYRELILRYCTEEPQDALSQVEQEISAFGTEQKDNELRSMMITLKNQLEYLANYHDYVNSVIENAEKMEKYRIFAN